MRLRLGPGACALGILLASGSAAASSADDRFTLRAGAMYAQGSGELFGRAAVPEGAVAFVDQFDLGKEEASLRLDGAFRISQRQRLIFDFFQFEKDAKATLANDVVVGGTTVPSGSYVKGEARFQLASLLYDYAVVEHPAFTASVQIGAEWASLKGGVEAEAGEGRQYRNSATQDGIAPVVGARLAARPGERLTLSAQGQYVDAGWGDFAFDGKIRRANALVEYRLMEGLGVFAGYDWFKVSYEQSGRDASGALDVEFKGPVAGLTWAF